jgi:hypothetical protein
MSDGRTLIGTEFTGKERGQHVDQGTVYLVAAVGLAVEQQIVPEPLLHRVKRAGNTSGIQLVVTAGRDECRNLAHQLVMKPVVHGAAQLAIGLTAVRFGEKRDPRRDPFQRPDPGVEIGVEQSQDTLARVVADLREPAAPDVDVLLG